MSAVPQRGPHVRELFVKTGPTLAVGSFETEQQESRTNYDISGKKKRRAPQPPVGLGQYTPKILSDNSDANIPLNHGKPGPAAPGHSRAPNRTHETDSSMGASVKSIDVGKSKAFIMGDKDTPLVLHSSPDTCGLEHNIRDLRVTSISEGEDVNVGTENPLFHLHAPHVNGHVPLSNGQTTHFEQKKMQEENGEPEGVYIPAPDYDEEEKTMVFSDEPDDDEHNCEEPGKKIYKEYCGEDFSQYLSDEENGYHDLWSRQKRSNHVADRKSKTDVKRSHYKKRETLPSKTKKDKAPQRSNSLRNFSYADSKFGSVNGGNKRLSVRSVSEGKGEAELFVDTGSSYEHFLRSKNGEELGDLLTAPSYGEEEKAGLPHVPARYTRPSHKKDTLWKKLTWKFKKQTKNGFDVIRS